uniref:RING-type domain-containing protein n=1 Tax=Fundulus heteroclitus TaxID=8078 RepID=A0A3Q2THQ2_FUNHE
MSKFIDHTAFAKLDRFLLRMKMGVGKSTPKEKCYDPSDTSLTFVDGDDDLDFLCEGFASPRAQMSCGHAVTPMSLTNWCLKQLEEGQRKFVCGVYGCNTVWHYKEVEKMALLTPEEIQHFKKMRTINAAVTRKCPGCKSPVVRQNEFNLCVSCKTCTEKEGRLYEFCWQCQREWKGPKPRLDRCENDGCCNTALQTLKTCPDIVFDTVKGITGCPSIRACPTCGSLLEHKRNHCKHLTCPQCKIKFCFVCLKTFAECSKTSGISAPCSSGVAPRQTFIPVWKKK